MYDYASPPRHQPHQQRQTTSIPHQFNGSAPYPFYNNMPNHNHNTNYHPHPIHHQVHPSMHHHVHSHPFGCRCQECMGMQAMQLQRLQWGFNEQSHHGYHHMNKQVPLSISDSPTTSMCFYLANTLF